MLNGNAIKTLFFFFFKAGIRSRRAKLFFAVSLIPTLIILIVRLVDALNPAFKYPVPVLFNQVSGVFFFQMFIGFLALFYGSSVLNDEVDNKTLVYLTTSPVSRGSILVGKQLAHLLLSAIVIVSGLLISFLLSNFENLLKPAYMEKIGVYLGVAMLALAAYSTLFTLMGAFLKRSILVGLFFIFGWEAIVQFLPGVTQKFTITHFIKSLLPSSFSGASSFLAFRLQPTPAAESIFTLLVLTLLFTAASVFIFYKKEYTLSEQS